MPFQTDQRLSTHVDGAFGEYLTTFVSDGGQARADLFRRGKVVVAHVSFPSGIDASRVTDPYVSELWDYAREHGLQEEFRVVLS
jgi:hypothetical protein